MRIDYWKLKELLMNIKRGYLYVASGRKFVEEAESSAKSLMAHSPEAN
ncbi:MAG: hypothetical protein ACI9GZ_001474 [Bacteroidia bacterium]|jgi:hypothetical protein